jgi:hypothetical protein
MTTQANSEGGAEGGERWLGLVRERVASLRFGIVQIVVHEGRVTQIDRTERLRLERSGGTDDNVNQTSRR